MTTEHSRQPGLPAWKYPQHVEAVLQGTITPEQSAKELARLMAQYDANRSPHILGQNRLEAVEARRFAKGLAPRIIRRRAGLSDADKLWIFAGSLLVACLAAWMFYNANFAQP